MTVCEAIQLPAVARESTATIIPPSKRNARVVVPWASLIWQSGLTVSSICARRKEVGFAIGGRENVGTDGKEKRAESSSVESGSGGSIGRYFWRTEAIVDEFGEVEGTRKLP